MFTIGVSGQQASHFSNMKQRLDGLTVSSALRDYLYGKLSGSSRHKTVDHTLPKSYCPTNVTAHNSTLYGSICNCTQSKRGTLNYKPTKAVWFKLTALRSQ
jgi:hypothetical protein